VALRCARLGGGSRRPSVASSAGVTSVLSGLPHEAEALSGCVYQPRPAVESPVAPEELPSPIEPSDLALSTRNQVVDAIMRLHGGALVVVGEDRRVVASNTAYLDKLGLERPSVGLLLGETAGCTFAQARGRGASAACLMKLFGEEVLGGQVDFTSSKAQGTTFSLRVPAAGQTATAGQDRCPPPLALTPVPGLHRVVAS
jgi:hypothetical protein